MIYFLTIYQECICDRKKFLLFSITYNDLICWKLLSDTMINLRRWIVKFNLTFCISSQMSPLWINISVIFVTFYHYHLRSSYIKMHFLLIFFIRKRLYYETVSSNIFIFFQKSFAILKYNSKANSTFKKSF